MTNALARPDEDAAIRALPVWSGPIDIAPLSGGITNRNFRVEAPEGRFVVRFGADIPLHGVMRFNELSAARAAHDAGLSPEVVHAGPGILVTRLIEGRALEPADVRRPETLSRIVDLVRRFHREVPPRLVGPVLAFWPFQVVRSYLATLHAGPCRIERRLAELDLLNMRLERALGPVEIVFGHNDLLAANLFDDGARLWLIDFDYAGMNSPLFDLANLSSNNGFDEAGDEALLAAYFGETPDAQRRRGFAAMACASLLREALWSAVSETRSEIAFDYPAYTDDYLARLDAALDRYAARIAD